MDRTYKIAAVPGDGIGKETVPEGLRVLEAAATRFGFRLQTTHYDWSCERYAKTGAMMPADGLDQLRQHDSIFLGAVGWPGVPDHISLWGLLIPIRRGFDQYASVRPCRLMPGARTPLAGRTEKDIDFYRRAREHRRRVLAASAAACSRAPTASSPPSRASSPGTAPTAS